MTPQLGKPRKVENINIPPQSWSSRSAESNVAGILSHFSVITTSHLAVVKSRSVVQMAANKCPPHTAMLMSFPGLCAQPVSIFSRPTRRGHSLLSPARRWITVLISSIQESLIRLHITAQICDYFEV